MAARYFISLAVLLLIFLSESQLVSTETTMYSTTEITTADTSIHWPVTTTSTTTETYWTTYWPDTTTETTWTTTETNWATTANTWPDTPTETTWTTTETYWAITDNTWPDTTTETTCVFTESHWATTAYTWPDTTTETTWVTTEINWATTDNILSDTTTPTSIEFSSVINTAELTTYTSITDVASEDSPTTTDTTTDATTTITTEFTSHGISPNTPTAVHTSTNFSSATSAQSSSLSSSDIAVVVLGTIIGILVIGIISFIIWKRRDRLFHRSSNQNTNASAYDSLALSSNKPEDETVYHIIRPETSITVQRITHENEYLDPDFHYRKGDSGKGRPLKAEVSHLYENQRDGHQHVGEEVSTPVLMQVIADESSRQVNSTKSGQGQIYEDLDNVCIDRYIDISKPVGQKPKERPQLPPKPENPYSNFDQVISGGANNVNEIEAKEDTGVYANMRSKTLADDKSDNV